MYIYLCIYIITYYVYIITYYVLPVDCLTVAYGLPIDCLSIALDAHMLSHNGYGPWVRVPGPYPLGRSIS